MAETNTNHIIKNFDQLATSLLRRQVLLIAEEGYKAIDTAHAVRTGVRYNNKKQVLEVVGRKTDLSQYDRILLIGFGKAANAAAKAILPILGDRVTGGLVIDLKQEDLGKVVSRAGTHPYPSEANVKATKEMAAMLEGLTEKDLVICIVSGGGSSLLCWPQRLSVRDQGNIFESLTMKGAAISEINTVRKHLSRVKGGNLARLIYPAACISLIFSDVPGDDPGVVASGPTVKDETTAAEAAAIMKKYEIADMCQLPKCELSETPKEDMYFRRVHNVLLVSAGRAVAAMEKCADNLGFKTRIFSTRFQGLARDLGREIVQGAKSGECVIGAGESTVYIKGLGKGGRNQEMALAALRHLEENQVLICLASDGHDNTEAAGAVADGFTRLRAESLGLDDREYLDNNDSFSFFEQTGDAVITGFTGSNVADFFVSLKN